MEKLILSHCVGNTEFIRYLIRYVKEEYFQNRLEKEIFKIVSNHVDRHAEVPPLSVIRYELGLLPIIKDADQPELEKLFGEIYSYESVAYEWIKEKTEQFCRDRAVYNAIYQSISIYEGDTKDKPISAIPDLLADAVSIKFDDRIADDFLIDADARWEYYNSSLTKIRFGLNILNLITDNGFARKSLSIILAGVHVGKTMTMVHLVTDYMREGKKVLYFTLEMCSESIFQRIEANFMNTAINEVPNLEKNRFCSRVKQIQEKYMGSIKVKEYPSGGATPADFRQTINELKNKQGWMPDIVIVDYLGITASAKRSLNSCNTNTYRASVAEELRAIATEYDIIVVTAHQLNRDGMKSSDAEMTEIADSIGITTVADFILLMTRNETLDSEQLISCKQLKNRFKDKGFMPRFEMGCCPEKQQLFDIESSRVEGTAVQTPEVETRFKKTYGLNVTVESEDIPDYL